MTCEAKNLIQQLSENFKEMNGFRREISCVNYSLYPEWSEIIDYEKKEFRIFFFAPLSTQNSLRLRYT